MRPCDCESRPAFFGIHPDELEDFLDGFDQLTNDRFVEYHLFRCPACTTLWIVDDMTRGPMAVRAADAREIEGFDERPYRRELLIAMHGGLSERTCMWVRCDNRAVNGVVFCVNHLYPSYAPDAPGDPAAD
jgi:hypothetical protein